MAIVAVHPVFGILRVPIVPPPCCPAPGCGAPFRTETRKVAADCDKYGFIIRAEASCWCRENHKWRGSYYRPNTTRIIARGRLDTIIARLMRA
jgi:hypothetical protein